MRTIYNANGIYDLDHVVAITPHLPVTNKDGGSTAVLHFKGHSLVTGLSYAEAVKAWDEHDDAVEIPDDAAGTDNQDNRKNEGG